MTTRLPAPLIFARREARLAALDSLPRPLWLGSLINSQGEVDGRLAGLRKLADALLAGGLAETLTESSARWPDHGLGVAICAALRERQLAAYCEDKPELTQQVISSLLWHLDHIVDYQDRGQARATAMASALLDFSADWDERCSLIDQLTAVFGELGDLPRDTRWGELKGLLKQESWQEVVRIRRLLESLPGLVALIRSLGRHDTSERMATAAQPVRELALPALAPASVARPVRVPNLPGETRGICRSARFARMLPAESLLLCHPRLRLVWHARHAERALLTYEDDDRDEAVGHDTVPTLVTSTRPEPESQRERGPILICVDTSGSMQGGAEAVAKACALEAVRTAHAEGRACHLFAFGGPDEVVERSLSLDSSGIAGLTDFLGQRFGGGTDICGPIERALARLHEMQWQQADLLIASDGDFGATPAVAARLHAAKQRLGVRVQGVLIGDRETIGLLELADDVFWVRDWRRYGGATERPDGNSPVHSKSLTAEYFPGALRTPGQAAPVASPDDSVRAIWPGLPGRETSTDDRA